MKTCHVCGFACENDAEICALCGAELKTFEIYEKELKIANANVPKNSIICTNVGIVKSIILSLCLYYIRA